MVAVEANGTFDLDITEASAATYYLSVVMPDGSIVTSSAIAFAG